MTDVSTTRPPPPHPRPAGGCHPPNPGGGREPGPVVAIDGPAGAGKSTVARKLAERLGYMLVDTGALYRGLALRAHERGVDWEDGEKLAELARSLRIELSAPRGGVPRLLLDGEDRSDAIRTAEISMGASAVSKHPEVRRALLGLQRQFGERGHVVLEGRDIGTVVFPDAQPKIFLTANLETRAKRRAAELRSRGEPVDLEATRREVQRRDAQDEQREVAPLKPAADAIVVDTSDLSIDQVVGKLVRIVHDALEPE